MLGVDETLECYKNEYTEEFLMDKWRSIEVDELEDKDNFKSIILDKFLPSVEFYAIWLRSLSKNPDTRYFKEFYETVLKDKPSFPLLLQILENALAYYDDELIDEDNLRSLFEDVLRVGGSDLFSGSELWARYIDFEINDYEDLMEINAPPEKIQKAKERVIKVFKRQLSLPLVGNESTLQKFEKHLGEMCSESDVDIIQPQLLNKNYLAGLALREGRLTYEMHLHSDRYESSPLIEKEASWKAYIDFEIKEKQISRAQRLYERSVLSCPESESMWISFAVFALCTVKNPSLCKVLIGRALKVHKYSIWLRKFELLSISSGISSLDESYVAMMRGISIGFPDASDYLSYLLAYCNCIRRVTDSIIIDRSNTSDEEIQKVIDFFQNALDQAEQLLISYYPDWSSGWWILVKYRSEVTYTRLAPLQRLLSLSEDVSGSHTISATKTTSQAMPYIKRKSASFKPLNWEALSVRFPGQYWIWKEAVQWLASKDEFDSCRSIFRRILHLNFDVSDVDIALDWLKLEDDHCKLDDVLNCVSRILPQILSKISNSKPSGKQGSELASSAAVPVSVPDKRKESAQSKEKRKLSQVQDKEISSGDSKSSSNLKKARKVEFSDDSLVQPEQSRKEVAVAGGGGRGGSGDNSSRGETGKGDDCPATGQTAPVPVSVPAINIKNLPLEFDVSELSDFFRQRLKFVSISELKTKSGAPRGNARVVVHDAENLQEWLSLSGIVYLGKTLQICIDEPSVPPRTTIFVSHLSKETDSDTLRQHFAACGEIVAARVAVDKKTLVSKCNALVQFASEEGRRRALKLNKSALHGSEISVSLSKFALLTESGEEGKLVPTSSVGMGVPKATSIPPEASLAGDALPSSSDRETSEKPTQDALKEVVQERRSHVVSTTTSFRPRGLLMKPKIQI